MKGTPKKQVKLITKPTVGSGSRCQTTKTPRRTVFGLTQSEKAAPLQTDFEISRDIFTPSGNMQRPDRVMIRGKHAIVIDYKFGQQKKRTYIEQVRDYMLLLENMGYTAEGYIIYTALNEISSVN